MKNKRKIIFDIFLVLFLTIISQTGGLIYIIASLIAHQIKKSNKYKKTLIFVFLYSISLLIVPHISAIFGREKLIETSNLKYAHFAYPLLNRNYVSPKLNKLLLATSKDLSITNKQIQIRVLDASFPFINGFPLFPHLSHNDGKKIDLSFVYENPNGKISKKGKSLSGYGVFEAAKPNEFNQTNYCKQNNYSKYDYSKYFTFGKRNKELKFSEKGTKQLLLALLKRKNLSKMFIEAHLKKRMHLTDSRIRFQGCKSVRHDDHIHIQIH